MIPGLIRSTRIYLKRWHPIDAAELLPLLIVNEDHLRPWIPQQVYTAPPLPELADRLAGYAASFDEDREWRYAIRTLSDDALIGEAILFARSDKGRVPLVEADRLEIGYWIDAARSGRGYATEATRALYDVACKVAGMARVEIRCDARNRASAAIPQRLGFTLAEKAETDDPDHLMVWYRDLT